MFKTEKGGRKNKKNKRTKNSTGMGSMEKMLN